MRKSWISILCLILASMTILSACSSSEKEGTGSEGSGESGGPVTMTFAPQVKHRWKTMNLLSLSKKFNVTLKWDLAPTDALQDRRQLLLASGDYPEVFLHGKFTTSDLQTYGKQGVFLPLQDLIKQYGPNLTKVMEEKPYFKDAITAPDGNIYALPILMNATTVRMRRSIGSTKSGWIR